MLTSNFHHIPARFYGAYINLLYTLFGVPSPHYVDPAVPRPEAWVDYPVLDAAPTGINLTWSNIFPGALFTVLLSHKHPVFFVQLNPPFALSNPDRRAKAHEQVVDHFEDLAAWRKPDEGLVTPWLPAVSVFGTKV
ncbi:hypothetical protein D9619_009782 [Psilocybe cf. subviscida]|uniref:Uncharacterized protein n=1 Tax=Psilocybe cf. subviscida TaxID=2480587 RepID=A0A8H5BM61_9AGAR|nr:hypothetical protein D9619_009782 [Psilocybe cf. subviscida]